MNKLTLIAALLAAVWLTMAVVNGREVPAEKISHDNVNWGQLLDERESQRAEPARN